MKWYKCIIFLLGVNFLYVNEKITQQDRSLSLSAHFSLFTWILGMKNKEIAFSILNLCCFCIQSKTTNISLSKVYLNHSLNTIFPSLKWINKSLVVANAVNERENANQSDSVALVFFELLQWLIITSLLFFQSIRKVCISIRKWWPIDGSRREKWSNNVSSFTIASKPHYRI